MKIDNYEFYYYDGTETYNSPQTNERRIELGILKHFLDLGGDILEVGAVSPYYWEPKHEVLDPYDKKATIKEDILNYTKHHHTIISISTLEHIGRSAEYGDPELRPERAVEAFKHCLKLSDLFVFTVPLDCNHKLDEFFYYYYQPIQPVHFITRDKNNYWREIVRPDLSECRYGQPYHASNHLIVGFIGDRS